MQQWMRLALEEARQAAHEGEVPVGAVGVLRGKLLAREHNRSLQLHDPTAHAEILLLRQLGRHLRNYRLAGVEIFVTLEPCAMCAGALIWARVKSLVFGARDEKAGAVGSRVSLLSPGRFNHELEIVEGILAEPCGQVLSDFFSERRVRVQC